MKLWDVGRGKEERYIGSHTELVSSVHWFDNSLILSTSADGSATVWDSRQRDAAAVELQAQAALLTGRAQPGSATDDSTDGMLIVATDEVGETCIWDVRRSAAPLHSSRPGSGPMSQAGWRGVSPCRLGPPSRAGACAAARTSLI